MVSGNWVVGTECALRGMERFKNSPGVFIAKDSPDFCRKLQLVMNSAPLELSQEDILDRSTLTWENTLNELRQIVEENYEN